MCRPVNDWLRGADCTTRSLAKARCGGGTIVRPLGGRRLGVCEDPARADDGSLGLSFPPPGFACRCSRASIILRCWSRTEMLRWSCSRMVGSWVAKPGERQAMPTSLIVDRLPPAVRGTVDPAGSGSLLRCSLGGLCLDGGSGEVGSFFTMILGSSFRLLEAPSVELN